MVIQPFKLFDYLKARELLFRQATRQLSASRGKDSFSDASEWMPDNYYLVQQTCRQIREDMPSGFYRQLPKTASGTLNGYPRIYVVAQELVVTSGTHLDIDHVKRFIHLFQDLTPLTTGELWALPAMLRLGILEALARALGQITGLQVENSLPSMTFPHAMTDDEIVANCIISLRMLSTQDWQVFFEDVSRVEHILRDDPANVYARMDRETRDRYRKVIEQLALATGKDEQRVAHEAIELAQRDGAKRVGLKDSLEAPRTAHVGYYLLDAGRARLETQLGYRVSLGAHARRWILKNPTLVYLGGIGLFTLIILLTGMVYASDAGATFLQMGGTGLFLLIPALTVSVSLINWIVTLAVPPRVLPKMDFDEGIPVECKTLVVIPSLLSSAAAVKSLLEELELHFLRNQDAHLYFALLTDLPDTPQLRRSGDDPLVEQAASGIRALNEKYHGPSGKDGDTSNPFYLLHRDPKWNPREEQWMGWERKRGKLHQLNLLLRGGAETAFSVQSDDLAVLRKIKYVITLDTGTIMPRAAAYRLVATLAHPLNRAEFDPRTGAVIAGYTVLQPGIEITSTSVNLSRFTRIFAGDVGLDLYTHAVSNAYQDLFGEGVYVGKGIYDIDAFERSLTGRMPENALLSHDLIEGIHGRVGLVTDIVLFEEYPPHYFVYIRRSRRWIRGDWQLLPWLWPRVPSVGKVTIPNALSVIARWKILDNLRRSLLSPALFVLFIAGWLWLPGSPLAWTLAGVLTLAVPVFTSIVIGLIQRVSGKSWHSTLHPFQDSVMRWILALVFILYETFVTLSGIATTLFRLYVTRKHLLQWTSYSDTVRLFAGGVTFRQMLAAMLASGALALLIAWLNPAALFVALPLLVAWMLAPEIAYWIGRPIRYAPAELSTDERERLRRLARRTWLFFEQFIGPEDHWLPPDHFQEAPRGAERVAHSTSPTDLGLLLLSTLAAYDLGYIGLWDLSVRLRETFGSMEHLEKYQGHFLNWYDTRSLEPLLPRYVSTVDSGNLVACLRTLRQGCQTLPHQPVLRWQNWEGLLDTLGLLDEIANDLQATGPRLAVTTLQAHLAQMRQQVLAAKDDPGAWAPLLTRLTGESWNELNKIMMSLVNSNAPNLSAESLNKLSLAADQVQNHLYGMQREIEQLSPWLLFVSQPPTFFTRADAPPAIRDAWQALQDALPTAPRLEELDRVCKAGIARLAELRGLAEDPQIEAESGSGLEGLYAQSQAARDWCAHLANKLESAATTADVLLNGLREIDERSERYFQEMNFDFLFDPQRQLFHIGYNVASEKSDSNYYDLLASEARIASFMSIAENQVPASHWLHLGRPLTQMDGVRALLSWGGTMFEYLMPALMMRSYEGTLLQRSRLAVVDVQIAYGSQKNVPWGFSESGYYAFDANQNYQYRTFGVPGLGFKRGLDDDLVVAPYASLLALSLRPRKVMENIARLDALQMMGPFGMYEAVDFSPARLALGEKFAIVRSYMAHHQGMILLSLVNYLQDDVMVRRFHADPLVRSVELLLQEKVPYDAPLESVAPEDTRATQHDPTQRQIIASPWNVPAQSPAPQVHCLSNGRYSVLITSAGGGYSCWQDDTSTESLDLTRWRADTTREDWGTWIYLQDTESGDLWSATYQPTAKSAESQDVQFYPYMAEFRRSDYGIGLTMEITVAPDDDVEIRRISLTNHSDRVRHIALTSYGEIILASQAVDARHPAFNKMFIESEYLPETNALLFRRRPRSTSDESIYLGHSAVVSPGHKTTGAHETDRVRFLGRGQTLRAPLAFGTNGGGLSGTTGATLDPIMAIGQEIELQPHASAQVSFITLSASSRDTALGLARRYQDGRVIVRAFEQARARTEAELRQLELSTTDLEWIEQLLSTLLYPYPTLRAEPATLTANRKGQAGLWPFSISGDYPILLVRMDKLEDLALVQQALQAHTYWRKRNIKIDLVILNQQGTTYGQELRGQLHRVLIRQNSEDQFDRRGGIFILYADQLGDTDRVLLETAARVVLDGAKGSLAQQLEALHKHPTRLPPFVSMAPDSKAESTPPLSRPNDLVFDNGLGGFSADGREYVIYLEPGQWTPAPWINVIANPDFGFTVSETGAGFTWFGNSSENRLTPWSNDPVADPPGEALYLRDEETAEVWSPTPLPCRAPAPYLIRHGAGYSIFQHNSYGLVQELRMFAVADLPVKVVQLRLENTWTHTRRITATFYAEWVQGVTRDAAQQYVVSEFDGDHQALLSRNSYNAEFGERVAFAAASKRLHGLTADRTEFLGRMGSMSHPAALDRIGLASAVEPGLDPCAALQLHIDLKTGESEEIFFLVGEGANRDEAIRLIEQYQKAEQIEGAWKQVNEFWNGLLGCVQVETPDPAMNLLLNRWLLYQTLSCRVWGRTAFYQSSGAFGFRDQLQDVMALMHAAPQFTREQILLSARHQFEAGDVLHWWHPPFGRGVRTRISDDLLWLTFVTANYVTATGDKSILDETIPFLQAPPLEAGEAERYDQYPATAEAFTLYEHCRRALEKGTTNGVHGLPLMGSGDWNDGMNRVGIEGRGESVWLGWFLYATLTHFAVLCEGKGDKDQAANYRQRAGELSNAIQANAWDGAWYRRAYYDDGTPLGSAANDEDQIDSIAQSWAVLSKAGDPTRAAQAMESVASRLVRRDDQLLLLLTPSFDKSARDPGYIKGYPPGIRENGGQYTHGALWSVWAFAELGQGDRAESLFHLLNPIYHSDTPEKVARYAVEPYVVASDVYSAPSHIGRGGWTWYSGSAGWMYRLGLEAILGVSRVGNVLKINPCIPKAWPGYKLTYRFGTTRYLISVVNPDGVNQGVQQVLLDGNVLTDNHIPLSRDGEQHQVQVRLEQAMKE